MRLLLLTSACLAISTVQAADPAPSPKVKLVVVLVFDQMRGDYIARWQPQFVEDGFQRLQTQGAWFTDCHYPYAMTATGPGHASILSGTGPSKHGIIHNDWYDRGAAASVYCAGSDRYQYVPSAKETEDEPEKSVVDPKAAPTTPKPKPVGNPDKILCPTVADVLKETTKGKAFGLSLKDRSAILPMGHKPDGAYWFVGGKFVTSTYYRESVPAWVSDFNKSGRADSYYGKEWVRFRPDLDYTKLAGPDEGMNEGKGVTQGTKFPHPMTGGAKKAEGKYYDALATSPFGNDLLFEFAKSCIDAEKLGQRDAADLLSISFSSNDLVGHAWGPESQEVLDVTLRSDAMVAQLLKYLDAKVGKGQYAVIVTADHGICPLPEQSAKIGKDAKRISSLSLIAGAEKHLREAYGDPKVEDGATIKSRWIEGLAAPHVYLNHRLIAAKKLKADDVAMTLAMYLNKQEGILHAYTGLEIVAAKEPSTDPIFERVKKSYYPPRSGDLYVVLKPYYLVGTISTMEKLATGTTHGSPHSYDTHVPLLVYGPGIAGGKREEKVTPLHAAPIAAWFLGLKNPKDSEYMVPKDLHER